MQYYVLIMHNVFIKTHLLAIFEHICSDYKMNSKSKLIKSFT